MFDKLTLGGLRGVGDVELNFRPGFRVRTLFGANGVGKTKCLEAIYQWLVLANKVLWTVCYPYHTALPSKAIFMNMAEDDTGRRLDLAGEWVTREEFATCSEQLHELPVLFIGARERSVLVNANISHGNNLPLGVFSERRERYLKGIFELLRNGDWSSAGMPSSVQHWFVQRAQSVNPYQKEADNRQLEINAVLEMLHAVDERIDEEALQIDGDERVFLKVEGQMCGLDELSSGFASLVKLMQAIVACYASFTNEPNLRHVPGIVLIDEIESHLHASWQSQIIPTLKKLLPNTTFYVATHSPLVLSQLEEGEAYLLERGRDGVVRTRVIDSPNRRAFVDVLGDALNVDLNVLKRKGMERGDQSIAKKKLLDLLSAQTGNKS